MSNEIPNHDSLLDEPLYREREEIDPDEKADDPCNEEEGDD